MKYWCNGCKSIIDEEDLEKYEEPSEAWGHTVYEESWLCPNCGGVPEEYEYQDKTCEDCTFYGEEECPYGWEGWRDKVCGDFSEGD